MFISGGEQLESTKTQGQGWPGMSGQEKPGGWGVERRLERDQLISWHLSVIKRPWVSR